MKSKKVGVLALQGAFAKHVEILKDLGADACLIRRPEELQSCEALIIPGGESTVISRGIDYIGMREAVTDFAQRKPIFGTCAGLILMAKTCHDPMVNCIGLLDIEVQRNGFGRQNESFSTLISSTILEKGSALQAVFIRAPRIKKTGDKVKVLATFKNEPILVQQGFHLGATFHPELTEDSRIHRYFLEKM